MTERSKMELLFEEYLKRDDLIKIIDGKEYYRIVCKEIFPARDEIVAVTLHPTLSRLFCTDYKVIDENGNIFFLGLPIFFRFIGDIPDWYLKTTTVPVEGVHSTDNIGDYFALYPDDSEKDTSKYIG